MTPCRAYLKLRCRPENCPMTPCRAYLKLRWRYIGPLLCLCWAPHDAMLAPCWAHVTLMLTQFPHLTKFCRSSKTMEKHSILEQKKGSPSPPDSHMKLYWGLSWAFVARISTYVGSMLAPYNAILVHMSDPCWAYAGPILGPYDTILGLSWAYVGPMLRSCWPIFFNLQIFDTLQKPWKNPVF